ncbi:MAG: hypothetical protein NTZ05_08195 [Chloroflexi bacterium]|nr:hypothetical protein [Chloroflexota bacterium]
MNLRRMIIAPAVFGALIGAAALGTPTSASAASLDAANGANLPVIADVSPTGPQSAVWTQRSLTNEVPVVNDRRRGRFNRRSFIISTGGGIVFPTGVVVNSNCGFTPRRVIVVRNVGCNCNAFAPNVIIVRRQNRVFSTFGFNNRVFVRSHR